jgi:TetR/AcrR family transcriptional regulator
VKLKEQGMLAEFRSYQNPQTAKEAQIVKAAERVFAELGYDGATTAELARRAGVTERTLFKYFPGKAHLYKRVLSGLLFAAIIPGHMADLRSRLLDLKPDFREWYAAILMARYQAVAAEPFRLRLLWGALLFSPDFSVIFGKLWRENLYETSVKAICHFQAKGQVRADLDASAIVRASFSLGGGFLLTQFVFAPELNLNPEVEIQTIVELFTRGVKM